MSSRKGQLTSIDFITSVVIFMVLIVFLVTFWFVSISHIEHGINENRMGAAAVSISDMLVKSPGVPEDWETDSSGLQAIGLASSPNVLSESKVRAFVTMDYNESKEMLGSDHDFYFYIQNFEGNRLYAAGDALLEEQAISVGRFAILNGEKVLVRVVIHG